jgi:hypothetical protein
MLNIFENFILGERAIRNGARVIAVVWSFSWIIFGFVSGIGEGLSPAGIAAHTLIPGFIFLASTLIAFWREGFGGVIILIEGLAITAYFATRLGSISAIGSYFVLFYGSLPALLVGSIFIYSWRSLKTCQTLEKGKIATDN